MNGRKVRFPSKDDELCRVVCSLPNCADIDPDEASAVWYKKSDFQTGRLQAKQVSRQCSNDGHSKYLDGTYIEKNRDAQERLCTWASLHDDARGLERWANKAHGELRQDDQFKVLMVVLEAQDSMVTYGEGILDWEKLKKVYQQASKVSRHFARMLGKADSYAVAPSRGDFKVAGGDADSVTTNTTQMAEVSSPIKKALFARSMNRKELDLLDNSTHSLSPLKRLRKRIQAKRSKRVSDRMLTERNMNERDNLIEVL